MARSLLPFTVCVLGSCHRDRASSTVSQFPSLMPSFLCALHATNAGNQIRTEEPRICRFIGESPDCCKPHVDGARCKQLVFEMNPVAGDHCFIEG